MRPRSPLLVGALAALLATLPGAGMASTPLVKYYLDGKRIPTPKQLPPVYPPKEQRRRIGGTVVVAFDYDADGKVTAASVKTSSGNQNLDKAAVVAVLQWTVAPPQKDGVPQAGSTETSLTFTP